MNRKIIRFPFIFMIKVYQFAISPILGKSCRHVPSCSNYAIEAIELHGILRGGWLSIKRISHCHPWGTSGYDPVPPKDETNSK